MELEIDLSQQAPETCTIQLTESQGARIRELILQDHGSFKQYLKKVGIAAPNAYAYLSGQKRISIQVLQKLLSGTSVALQCNLDIILVSKDGDSVRDVDYANLEDSLFSDEMDEWEDQMNAPPTSSSSEKPLEAKKITPDSHSKESLEGYLTSSSTESSSPSGSQSQTQSDADQPRRTSMEN